MLLVLNRLQEDGTSVETSLLQYLTDELYITYDADDFPEDWVNENLEYASISTNATVGGLISTQRQFETYSEEVREHFFKAIAILANYRISKRIFSEGESYSASLGSLSYSTSNTRSPDYAPYSYWEQLELTGVYSRDRAVSAVGCSEEELELTDQDDPYAIMRGENQVITHKQTEELIDSKLNDYAGTDLRSDRVETNEPELEGGANVSVALKALVKKTDKLSEEGHIDGSTEPTHPASREYVDQQIENAPKLSQLEEDGKMPTNSVRLVSPSTERMPGQGDDVNDQTQAKHNIRASEIANILSQKTNRFNNEGKLLSPAVDDDHPVRKIEMEEAIGEAELNNEDRGRRGLLFKLQDDVQNTANYKQSQEHDDHDDSYFHFFKPQINPLYPIDITEETFGAGNKKKFWMKFPKAGSYILSSHTVLRFSGQNELRYYFLHVHEHKRAIGDDGLGEVEHKIEREVSIQISREDGEINWTILIEVSEEDLEQEYVWSLKAETKKERGVHSGDPERRINDIDISVIGARSFMLLSPTTDGLTGRQGEKGDKGDTGATGDGFTPDDRANVDNLITGSASERAKVSALQNIVGSYAQGVVKLPLVSRVQDLEDAEGGVGEITTTDIQRTGASEGSKATQKGLNDYYNASIKQFKKALFLPAGAGTLDQQGAYLNPGNFLENNQYFLFEPLNNVGDNTAGGLTVATNSIGNTTRSWVSFDTAGYYSVKFRLSVLFTDAIADGTISDVRLYQHEKVGADTEGAGTSSIKATKSVFRFISKWSTTIDIEALTHISRQTAQAGNRYFTWSLRFNKIRLSDNRIQADTISQINATESHFMSIELVWEE